VKRLTSISCVGIAAALCLFCSSPARATEWNELTYFTFTAPFELPGVALPPGTYVFKHPDSPSNQNIVQVFSEDEKTLFGTFLTVPFDRATPTSKPSVMFQETAKGAPDAVEAWFYPGRVTGDKFIYPDEHGVRRVRGAIAN
jgi:hypothetical protein